MTSSENTGDSIPGNDALAQQAIVTGIVCRHIAGISFGTTALAFYRHGVLGDLAASDIPVAIDVLAKSRDVRRGYFHLAFNLLSTEGLVERSGDIPAGDVRVMLTPQGRAWVPMASAYEQMPALIEAAVEIPALFDGGDGPDFHSLRDLLNPPVLADAVGPIADRVRGHLEGPVVSIVMYELYRRNLFDKMDGKEGKPFSFAALGLPGSAAELAFHFLDSQGWVTGEPAALTLTTAGKLACLLCVQTFYPLGYIPTYRRVPEMIFCGDVGALARDEAGNERHVDRELDIEFSGLVFEKTCKAPFFEIVLPLFDREPLSEQPVAVIDSGSGDGTLLRELFFAIRDKTRRGAALADYPLVMIGAEYNAEARLASERALSDAGVPHLCLFGDISDPGRLKADLAKKGIDAANALHVSKSVIHNRPYRPPRNKELPAQYAPMSTAVFVDPEGELISAHDLELNLVEHFIDWRQLAGRYGMVVIEAHTMDPGLVGQSFLRSMITSLNASHGFSHQYLVEVETFRNAAGLAGYQLLASRDIASAFPRPVLSINHFKPAEAVAARPPLEAAKTA